MSSRPNAVFVLVDDMGYGDFGVFGDGSPQTPRLDALVDQGLCLTQHYSGAPVCAPARACLLTGRYALRGGVIDTQDANGLDRVHPDERTIGEMFQRAGYATGLVGKWHSGAYDPAYHPTNRGFDEFAGFQGGWNDYYSYRLEVDGRFTDCGGRYMTDVLTDEAVAFIDRHAGRRARGSAAGGGAARQSQPFFLWLCYNAPHFPFQAPSEDIARFRDLHVGDDLRALYAMIYRMDQGLGRVLDKLRECGIEEDTVVVFTSDNGPQMSPNVRRYNANFAGAKGNVYEGGIRVPAVIRLPGRIDEGSRSELLMHFVDWMPTLSAICDVPLPTDAAGPLDGIDISSDLLSTGGSSDHKPRFWQWNRYEPVADCNAAVRDGDWKLLYPQIDEAMELSDFDISTDKYFKSHPEEVSAVVPSRYERSVPSPHPPQLYNLADDPFEQNDLATVEVDRTARMGRMLETWFEEVEAERRSKTQGYA